jgi:hypothetical protein
MNVTSEKQELWLAAFLGASAAALLVYLGWRLARFPPREMLPLPGRIPSMLPASPLDAVNSAAQTQVASVQVTAKPVLIVEPLNGAARVIRIATDQPIRVAATGIIGSRPELGVPVVAGQQAFEWGIVGPNERLYAVVAPGGATANVSVLTQLAR